MQTIIRASDRLESHQAFHWGALMGPLLDVRAETICDSSSAEIDMDVWRACPETLDRSGRITMRENFLTQTELASDSPKA